VRAFQRTPCPSILRRPRELSLVTVAALAEGSPSSIYTAYVAGGSPSSAATAYIAGGYEDD
jgi:hypothetical protein